MSIVDCDFLRIHYEQALQDLECMSSAFWQVTIQEAFFERRMYAVTSESPPDKSLRRVDLVVKRFDSSNHTLSALLWIEFKRKTGSVKDVERQALDAAKRSIKQDDLTWIWAMTTVGVSFRMWFISKDTLKLQPMHGGPPGDRSQYIDADSAEASIFPEAIRRIKKGIPLRVAPVVPSQSLDLLNAGNVGQDASQPSYNYNQNAPQPSYNYNQGASQSSYNYNQGASQSSYNYNQDASSSQPTYNYNQDASSSQPTYNYNQGTSQPTYNYNQGASQSSYNYNQDQDMAEAGPSRVSGDGSDGNGGQYVQVTVEKIPHTFSADQFVFRDVKGKSQSTNKDDWESGRYQGHKVWMCRVKKIVYFSRTKIA